MANEKHHTPTALFVGRRRREPGNVMSTYLTVSEQEKLIREANQRRESVSKTIRAAVRHFLRMDSSS